MSVPLTPPFSSRDSFPRINSSTTIPAGEETGGLPTPCSSPCWTRTSTRATSIFDLEAYGRECADEADAGIECGKEDVVESPLQPKGSRDDAGTQGDEKEMAEGIETLNVDERGSWEASLYPALASEYMRLRWVSVNETFRVMLILVRSPGRAWSYLSLPPLDMT